MMKICGLCASVIEDGDSVTARIKTVYHQIASTNCFAVEKQMELVPDTLQHVNCQFPQGENEGD